jgi:uncharacterized protein (DUF1697 family)
MPVVVSLLRGVNVGGRNKMHMEALRTLCEDLGFEKPQTLVQSGNVVFETRMRNLTKLAPAMENAIQQRFGFHSAVILRVSEDLRQVLAKNPFAGETDIDGSKLLVTFFADEPGSEVRDKILSLPVESERVHLIGRELYVHFPEGMGRSKLGAKLSGLPIGTSRNWNTVCKLLSMAEARERP